MSERESPIDGAWYWVTYDGKIWFPAKADKQRAGGWSNDDTWEDFTCEITEWVRIRKQMNEEDILHMIRTHRSPSVWGETYEWNRELIDSMVKRGIVRWGGSRLYIPEGVAEAKENIG